MAEKQNKSLLLSGKNNKKLITDKNWTIFSTDNLLLLLEMGISDGK